MPADEEPEIAAQSLHLIANGSEFDGGKFLIKSLLGAGGMSCVYLAHDRNLDREVALKIMSADLDSKSVVRFQNEARALSLLDHPNIIKVLSFGTAEGSPYLVMELLSGKTLAQLMASGPQPPEKFWPIFSAVLDAMIFAHAHHIVHRDLKPSNIMICDSGTAVKILDFGIAKIQDPDLESQSTTATGASLGSPLYMSPEQCRGNKADERSDIYSLACSMYEYLVGKPPFSGSTPFETMYEHLHSTIPELETASGQVRIPPALGQAIAGALAKKPEDRPASMSHFKELLQTEEARLDTDERTLSRRHSRMKLRQLVIITLIPLALLTVIGAYQIVSKRKVEQLEQFEGASQTSQETLHQGGVRPDALITRGNDKFAIALKIKGKAQEEALTEAEKFLKRGVELARQDPTHSSDARLSEGLERLAAVAEQRRRPDEAINYYKQGIAVHKGKGENGKDQRLYNKRRIGELLYNKGLYDEGIKCYEEAISEYEALGEDPRENIGNAYYTYAQTARVPPEKRRIAYAKALAINQRYSKYGDLDIRAICIHSGVAYMDWAYNEKQKGIEEELRLEKLIDDTPGSLLITPMYKAQLYETCANTFVNMMRNQDAIRLYDKAIAQVKKLSDPRDLAYGQMLITSVSALRKLDKPGE